MGLVILTGASGAGKTAIVQTISEKFPEIVCLYFDSIGIPTLEQMVATHGSGEQWQQAMTSEWFKRIKSGYKPSQLVIFEGQTRISFILQGLKESPIEGAKIVLIDCDDETRKLRLIENRKQPDLANSQMMNWARFLRSEAKDNKIKIIDTSKQNISESVAEIRALIGRSL